MLPAPYCPSHHTPLACSAPPSPSLTPPSLSPGLGKSTSLRHQQPKREWGLYLYWLATGPAPPPSSACRTPPRMDSVRGGQQPRDHISRARCWQCRPRPVSAGQFMLNCPCQPPPLLTVPRIPHSLLQTLTYERSVEIEFTKSFYSSGFGLLAVATIPEPGGTSFLKVGVYILIYGTLPVRYMVPSSIHHHHHQKAFRNKSHTSHGHRPGLKRNKSKGKIL